nr:hypothetical protein [uncultured Cetobacterium sp.]
MKGNKIILGVIGIIFIWSFYGYLIRKISYLEKTNLKLDKEIRELEKKRSERVYKYDVLMDLSKIEKEMNKKDMQISEEINFFKLQDNSF